MNDLWDGTVWFALGDTPHQMIIGALAMRSSRRAGLHVRAAIPVRLAPLRIVSRPVVTGRSTRTSRSSTAASVRLVGEIVSPSSATDKVLKMHYYARRHPWYLLVEQDTGTSHELSVTASSGATSSRPRSRHDPELLRR